MALTASSASTPPTSARGTPSSPPPAPSKPSLVRVVEVDPFQRTVRLASLPARQPGALDSAAVADRLCYDLFDTDDYAPPPGAPARLDTVYLQDEPFGDESMELRAHVLTYPRVARSHLPGALVCGTALRGKAIVYASYAGAVQPMSRDLMPDVAWLPSITL